MGAMLKGCGGHASASFSNEEELCQENDVVENEMPQNDDMSQNDVMTYGNWIIERIVVDSNYLFKKRYFQTYPYQELSLRLVEYIDWASYESSGIAPMTMSEFLDTVVDLVAFRDGSIYAITHVPTKGFYDYVGFTTGVSVFNYIDENVRYQIDSGAGLWFGGIDFAHHIHFDHDRDTTFSFHVDSRESGRHDGGVFRNQLIRNSWATDLSMPPHIDIHNISIITTIYSTMRPIVSYSEGYVIFNYIDEYGRTYVLGYLDAAIVPQSYRTQHPLNEITRENFMVDEHGLMTGRIPLYAARDEDGIFFQVITLDGELLDFGGTSSIYFYSFNTGQYTHVLDLDDSITYINGKSGVIVYNYYSVDNPRVATGRIVFLEDGHEVTIPHISPVNDITYSSISDEYIFIISRYHALIYNVMQQSFEYLDARTLSNRQISNIRFMEGQFGWICFSDDDNIIFYRATLE